MLNQPQEDPRSPSYNSRESLCSNDLTSEPALHFRFSSALSTWPEARLKALDFSLASVDQPRSKPHPLHLPLADRGDRGAEKEQRLETNSLEGQS